VDQQSLGSGVSLILPIAMAALIQRADILSDWLAYASLMARGRGLVGDCRRSAPEPMLAPSGIPGLEMTFSA
jgi:hypothetical protein